MRRLDSRVPTPLLSTFVSTSTSAAAPNLGKLANVVNPSSTWRVPSKPGSLAPPAAAQVQVVPPVSGMTTASGARGWGLGLTPAGNPKVVTSTTVVVPAPAPLLRASTPDVGSGTESTVVAGAALGNVDDGSVPDNWEDDV